MLPTLHINFVLKMLWLYGLLRAVTPAGNWSVGWKRTGRGSRWRKVIRGGGGILLGGQYCVMMTMMMSSKSRCLLLISQDSKVEILSWRKELKHYDADIDVVRFKDGSLTARKTSGYYAHLSIRIYQFLLLVRNMFWYVWHEWKTSYSDIFNLMDQIFVVPDN